MQSPYKKILILSVSAGAGHVRAADALVKAFQNSGAALEIVHLDTLQYTSKAVRALYSKAYFDIARSAPDVLGWIYDYLDKPWKNEKKMRALERLNVALFMRVLRRIQPDLVISTHFLPADIITYLRKKEKLNCKQAVVITDYDAHAMWLNRDVDLYFSACEEESVYLKALGIASERVITTGIPIDLVFSENKNKTEMRVKYGLHPDIPVVIISAGGFGVSNMQHILQALNNVTLPLQVLAMCGYNQELLEQVQNAVPASESLHIHPIAFTTQMDEYMSASDIMIGKPGGLTTSESLAKGLAIIVINPIPGQEERNTDYILENGAGLKCNNLPTLAYKIELLLKDVPRLHSMQNAALKLSKPQASTSVVEAIMDLAS